MLTKKSSTTDGVAVGVVLKYRLRTPAERDIAGAPAEMQGACGLITFDRPLAAPANWESFTEFIT